jgi:hypothetical protein
MIIRDSYPIKKLQIMNCLPLLECLDEQIPLWRDKHQLCSTAINKHCVSFAVSTHLFQEIFTSQIIAARQRLARPFLPTCPEETIADRIYVYKIYF